MTESGYVLAVDQGTTGTTAILVDGAGRLVWKSSQEIGQIYPQPGWVEQDPQELFTSSVNVVGQVLKGAGVGPGDIVAMGITNQRETTLVWDKRTGQPLTNAIVWQCRRTAPLCEAMKSRGLGDAVAARTGLPIDAYFSATKIRWILDNIVDGQSRAEAGKLLFGTVDSWLLWKFTNGTVHATDVTNASRTMLFNIAELRWDGELLREMNIPAAILPEVKSSGEVYGHMNADMFQGHSIPIAGVAGDQQAALFGQACFRPGMTKNTYGTGSFVLMNIGTQPVASSSGLVTTIAWGLDGEVFYALEGSVFSTGATVQWLRDGLGAIRTSSEVEALASSVPDTGDVYLVPAFTGLGAPHWDMYARGTIVGMSRGTTIAHIARAALEATAYQTRDVIDAMTSDTGLKVPVLRVDGGGTANGLLMQLQADVLDTSLERSGIAETTALGAAYLAGLSVGFWADQDEISELWKADRRFEPGMDEERRQDSYGRWKSAVARAKGWASERP